jgi:hypothetical protein
MPLGPFRDGKLWRRAQHCAHAAADMATGPWTDPLQGLLGRSDRPPPSAGR